MNRFNTLQCNNCGNRTHNYNQCKLPIISIGGIAFRRNTLKNNQIEYLMICRKHTLGYMDFMRGKYSLFNKEHILNLLKEMSVEEKNNIISKDFSLLWNQLWNKNENDKNNDNIQYNTEEFLSFDKITSLKHGINNNNDYYTLKSLLEESNKEIIWQEPEWGFPKGRRNPNENDIDCGIREFLEETGYTMDDVHIIENIVPFEEIFMGSNYKSYKHKYYLLYMDYENSIKNTNYDNSEVSKVEWKTFEECIECIRPYNLEKKKLIKNINSCIYKYSIYKVLC
jgi:ADP-ribose pyrophosphatase YjhB (NUDIX family)